MAEVRWINNLKGILYYMDVPVIDFEIRDRSLIKAMDISNGRYFPEELHALGINYGSINEFFNRRTMKEGCMFYREHLKAMGMDTMDFDRYIMMKNGNNNLDNFWVRFEGFGAQSFYEMLNQNYPVTLACQ